jgi:hypothetical protein
MVQAHAEEHIAAMEEVTIRPLRTDSCDQSLLVQQARNESEGVDSKALISAPSDMTSCFLTGLFDADDCRGIDGGTFSLLGPDLVSSNLIPPSLSPSLPLSLSLSLPLSLSLCRKPSSKW